MSGLNTRSTALRAAAFALLGTLSLGACASRSYVDQRIAEVNGRIDSVDAQVQQASQRADAAATDARTANQRLDQMEGRVGRLEQMPARRPRG